MAITSEMNDFVDKIEELRAMCVFTMNRFTP